MLNFQDGREYAEARVQKLVEAGVINALVALSSTDSESSKELLSRSDTLYKVLYHVKEFSHS